MLCNADLHIHSRFSGGVSKEMKIKVLGRESRKKGIQLLGTGDCLHSGWLEEIKELDEVDDGTYEMEGTRFVLTVEVEDNRRVHHLIIFPAISKVEEFKERILGKAQDLESDGRPKLHMDGEEIAQIAKDCGSLIGPCHAFTPWTGIYAVYDSISGSYGDLTSYISLVELGLSADTDYADRIGELADLTFVTNSDAHSPYPIRLAREFNRFVVDEITFEELRKALLREGRRRSVLNVGLPPQEGKYNESACIKCFKHYTLRESVARKWKCSCGGRIKKGVRDRVEELADYEKTKHPFHRPPYLHLIPLAEIIAKALGTGPQTKEVFAEWNRLVSAFGDEVSVLVDRDISDIGKVACERVKEAVRLFRDGKVTVQPGGGGQYGRIEIDFSSRDEVSDENMSSMEMDLGMAREKRETSTKHSEKQRSLLDF